MEVGVLFQGTNTVQHIPLREAECTMSALQQSGGMCTNPLNCTHSPLIDGAELLRSTGQILQRVKHGLSDRLNSPEHRRTLDFYASFFTRFYYHVNAVQPFKWKLAARRCILHPHILQPGTQLSQCGTFPGIAVYLCGYHQRQMSLFHCCVPFGKDRQRRDVWPWLSPLRGRSQPEP